MVVDHCIEITCDSATEADDVELDLNERLDPSATITRNGLVITVQFSVETTLAGLTGEA